MNRSTWLVVIGAWMAGCGETPMCVEPCGLADGGTSEDGGPISEDDAGTSEDGGRESDGGGELDAGLVMDDGGAIDAGPIERDAGPIDMPETGWTELAPSPDSRFVYVSSSGGDDTNDGLSEARAVRTLARGLALVRTGMPDRLLLRRGDTWTSGFSGWGKSGRSASEPLVLGAYGEGPRPRLRTGDGPGWLGVGGRVDYVAIVSIHFDARDRGDSDSRGVGRTGNGRSILVEDCVIEGYQDNLVFEARGGAVLEQVTVRRSIVADAYARYVPGETCTTHADCTAGACSGGRCGPAHSQGIYAEGVRGLSLEENVFDHNGWHEDRVGAWRTAYNHGMYLHHTTEGVVVRGNVITNSASHGLQARSGGVVENNLFAGNAIGMSFGLVYGLSAPLAGGVEGVIRGNVVRTSNDIGSSPRGDGIQLGNIRSLEVANNVIAHYASAEAYGHAIYMDDSNGVGIEDTEIHHNVVYDWYRPLSVWNGRVDGVSVHDNVFDTGARRSPIAHITHLSCADWRFARNTYFTPLEASGPAVPGSFVPWSLECDDTGSRFGRVAFIDPDRSLGSYQSSIAGSRGADWLAGARMQARGAWRVEYTAASIVAYLSAGLSD
jgi:hypothetical protein